MTPAPLESSAWMADGDLDFILGAMEFQDDAVFAWLECDATTYLDAAARQDGIQLKPFDRTKSLRGYASGRVFACSGELKWQRLDSRLHCVWCGSGPAPAGFQSLPHGGVTAQDIDYVLWGRRVSANSAGRLGLTHDLHGQHAYMQLQIPRVLRYPLPGNRQYALVTIRESFFPDGRLAYSRWVTLKEASV